MACFDKVAAQFIKDGTTVTITKIVSNHSHPVSFNQAIERTAAGTLRVEKLGDPILGHAVTFDAVEDSEYTLLRSFLINTVTGAGIPFTFIDEYGVSFNVAYIDNTFNFTPDRYHRWSGTITLEDV